MAEPLIQTNSAVIRHKEEYSILFLAKVAKVKGCGTLASSVSLMNTLSMPAHVDLNEGVLIDDNGVMCPQSGSLVTLEEFAEALVRSTAVSGRYSGVLLRRPEQGDTRQRIEEILCQFRAAFSPRSQTATTNGQNTEIDR